MNKKIIWAIITLIVIAGIYYAMTYRSTYPTQVIDTPERTAQQTATTEPVLKVGTSTTLGSYLTASNGFTVYTFSKDTAGVSNCSGTCAKNWPPYIVPAEGSHIPEPAVTGTVGTLQRSDGTIQLTYNGMPVYFWVNDTKVGDTTGNGFNNLWHVIKP